jgi:Bacterial cell division membrane protein
MKIATEAKDEAGKMLATGISIWIILQAFWNIAGMLGLFPLKGIPLPFISEGGSAMVVNLLSIGILLNGYRARIRNHGHSCFLCEIVIRSQFHTTYEPEA